MIVFERLVGEYEISSGEVWVYKSNAPCSTGTQDTPVAHLWFTTGLRHHLSGETVMAARPFNDNGRSANGNRRCVWRQKARKANTPRARKARTRAKESTRVNTRAVLSLRAIVITVGSGDTSKKTCTNTVAEVDGNLLNLQRAVRAAARPESHHHLLVCLHLDCAVHDGIDLHADGGSRAVWLALNLWWDLMMQE